MNRYQKAIKYTKPLTEIDEKIARLEEEMMTTSGMYVTGYQIDDQPYVAPTFGEIPDGSLGDFSDLNSFTQNADTDNVSQLLSVDASGTSTPINSVMDLPGGGSALAMATNGRPAQGVVYGYVDSQNVFHGVFTIGGLYPSGRGQSALIDAGLDWYDANVAGKTIETIRWKCYNSPDIWDGLYTPLAQNVGPDGNYNLHYNNLLFVKNQNFMTNAGIPRSNARFVVQTRDDLGNVNFLSVLMGVANLVLDALVDAYAQASDQIGEWLDLFGDGSTASEQLKDYSNWLDNPSDQRTKTRLDSGDKSNIINEADKFLESRYNPDGSPKNPVAADRVEANIGKAIQMGLNNSFAATNIHGQLPTVNGDVLFHNQPTNQEGISPDGTGGMNLNDGYDFSSVSQFDIGNAEIGPVNLSNLAGQAAVNYATGGSASDLIGGPRQPIQTNLSAYELQGTLLGNVIQYHNLSPRQSGGPSRRFSTESFVMSENKSGLPDKYKLMKFISKEGLQKLQKRYPGSDPRLAELNWKMDNMMGASNAYINKQFPENVEQTSRVKKILARNIELSDPKTFKDPKQPMTYGKMYGNDSNNKRIKIKDFNKKSAGRFFRTEKKVDTSRTRWIKG